MNWLDMVLAGIVASALGAPVGDVLKWLLWKLIAKVGEIRPPVGDVLMWLLWKLIAMVGEIGASVGDVLMWLLWKLIAMVGEIGASVGDFLMWLLWKLIAIVGEIGASVGDVMWLLWKLIAMVRERLVLGWSYAGALLNATPGVQTSESSASANGRADGNDFTDSESGGNLVVSIGGEPNLEDHDAHN